MESETALTPWGRLIEDARKRKKPKLSQRRAAEAAGISDTRWRQIVAGAQRVGDVDVPIKPPEDTLARMARAVGVTPAELAESGVPGVAEVLEALLSQDESAPDPLDGLMKIRDDLDRVIAQLRGA